MENNREHYYGLSLAECEKLYQMKWETFRREWREPLEDMIKKHIVNRIKAIDETPEEEAKKYNSSWQVDLPFYIPMEDGKGDRQWWGFMETPAEIRRGSVLLSRIDDDSENTVTHEVIDLSQLLSLEMWLNRMGFWDDDQRGRFKLG